MNKIDEHAPRRHLRCGTPGFTMIEIMAVMVILVVAILGFVFGLGASVQDLSASGQSFHALNAARSKVAELKTKDSLARELSSRFAEKVAKLFYSHRTDDFPSQ